MAPLDVAPYCLGRQSEAPGQQHWRATPCAVGHSCSPSATCLFRSTGERNGFTVLTEAEFYDFHLTTPDLSVMLMRVGAACAGHACGPSKAGGPLAPCHFLACWAYLAHSAAPRTMPPATRPAHVQDKDDGRIITFCTGVRAGDTLMPMWCAVLSCC